MFKKTRRKIVAAIMSVLVLIWAGTLGVIYGSSYYEVSNRNRKMLEQHAQMYLLEADLDANMSGLHTENSAPELYPEDSLPEQYREASIPGRHTEDSIPDQNGSQMFPDNIPGPNPGIPHFENTPAFQLSTFYSVAVSKDGQILAVTNGQAEVYEDDELAKTALEVMKSGKTDGVKSSLIYHMTDKGGYILVAFMDNTIMQESMTTLFRYTLIFGGFAILAFFFLAVYLARKIVRPLEESYDKQKQFISDAGHELKTPVSVVSTNAELLSREIGENQWLANIQYENERMGILVGQLLELAHTEDTAPQMESVDLCRLVSGEALPFESVVFEKRLTLECEAASHLYVNGNSTQLKQLTAILLDNAIRHCQPNGKITLGLKGTRNYAVLSVMNDGAEIPEAHREQIFERFYRMDTARNSDGQHYGLGLAIAKAIVSVHHGKIDVQCRNGKVKFIVRIPLQK